MANRLRPLQPGLLLTFFLFLADPRGAAAQEPDPVRVNAAIQKHFGTVTPELTRYMGVVSYGETISGTTPTKEVVARERELYDQAVAAGLMKPPAPGSLVLNLGHSLILHDPPTGLAYLKALHESAGLGNKGPYEALFVGTVAAGEPGERMAVGALASKNREVRFFWATYLERQAIYVSSAEPIQKHIDQERDETIKPPLIRALAMIGDPKSLKFLKNLLDLPTSDEVHAAAIFAYAELVGFDGISHLEKVKTIGPVATRQRDDSVGWLKAETRANSKHGREVVSDGQFVARFGDLHASPVIRWLTNEGLLRDEALKDPPKLTPLQKNQLLDLLVDSKGFGLEAVKGSLFKSLSKEDEPALLQIRAAGFYSPSPLSGKRLQTIGIMLRYVRQEL
jgi:hypothetical protein